MKSQFKIGKFSLKKNCLFPILQKRYIFVVLNYVVSPTCKEKEKPLISLTVLTHRAKWSFSLKTVSFGIKNIFFTHINLFQNSNKQKKNLNLKNQIKSY